MDQTTPNDGHLPEKVALIGAGTMGMGFAQVFGMGGIQVSIADASAEIAETAVEKLVASAGQYERDGLFAAGSQQAIESSVTAADTVEEAAEGAEFVLEAVSENEDVKRSIYSKIDTVIGSGAILASNTSAIPITKLAESVANPERFLGTHWFNPPQFIPCVEIIPAPLTAPEVVEQMMTLHRHLGKSPVVVGDGPGFVANRIQFAMFKEAVSVVASGVASAEAVDEVVRNSFGFRLPVFGPFAIADMAGLDVYVGAFSSMQEGLGERFSCPEEISELVSSGRTGAKSGGGFMDWPEDKREKVIAGRDAKYAALYKTLNQD